MSTQLFGLADCNNFYASCERVFRPDLAHRPVIVLSNNDGCVIARSQEVKKLGIPMGAPIHEWQAYVDKYAIQVFSANFALYGDFSSRVMETLERFSKSVEVYSIDEAFLDVSAIPFSSLQSHGVEIVETVRQWTKIPISLGIAPTKTLSKVANEWAKKHNQDHVCTILKEKTIDLLLSNLDVSDIWGIGSRYAAFLYKNNIKSALDLKHADEWWIKRHLYVVGMRTVLELRGISCIPLETGTPAKKGIMTSRSFGRTVATLEEMKEAVGLYMSRCAEKLRLQHSTCKVLTVFISTNPFQEHRPQYRKSVTIELPRATNFTPELIEHAHAALERIYHEGYWYHKAGVYVTDIREESQKQLHLFVSEEEQEKQRVLMTVMDALNAKHGRGTLQFASVGQHHVWKMRQAHRSPRYTTKITELPLVRA